MISLIDYRDKPNSRFFGYRLYISNKPDFVVQEWYSFRENGKIVSKKRQNEILKIAQIREKALIKEYGIEGKVGIFKKRGNTSIGIRTYSQPCRLAGMNITLQREYSKNFQVQWEDKGNDILFRTYPPIISIWRGSNTNTTQVRIPFRCRRQFFDAYNEALESYYELYDLNDDLKKKAIKLRPKWEQVRQFVIEEAQRIYPTDNYNFGIGVIGE